MLDFVDRFYCHSDSCTTLFFHFLWAKQLFIWPLLATTLFCNWDVLFSCPPLPPRAKGKISRKTRAFILTLKSHWLVLIWCYIVLCYDSPPANSEGSQPKTQAAATQEELTQEERHCSAENSTAEMDNDGQIHSVLPIIKSPSPDVHGHYPPAEPEPLGQKRTGLQRYSGGWLNRIIHLCGPRENNKVLNVTSVKKLTFSALEWKWF